MTEEGSRWIGGWERSRWVTDGGGECNGGVGRRHELDRSTCTRSLPCAQMQPRGGSDLMPLPSTNGPCRAHSPRLGGAASRVPPAVQSHAARSWAVSSSQWPLPPSPTPSRQCAGAHRDRKKPVARCPPQGDASRRDVGGGRMCPRAPCPVRARSLTADWSHAADMAPSSVERWRSFRIFS